jgi:hypothetical protein
MRYYSRAAMEAAIRMGHIEAFKVLLNDGMELEFVDRDNNT